MYTFTESVSLKTEYDYLKDWEENSDMKKSYKHYDSSSAPPPASIKSSVCWLPNVSAIC